jgi:hypothetical protein
MGAIFYHPSLEFRVFGKDGNGNTPFSNDNNHYL